MGEGIGGYECLGLFNVEGGVLLVSGENLDEVAAAPTGMDLNNAIRLIMSAAQSIYYIPGKKGL